MIFQNQVSADTLPFHLGAYVGAYYAYDFNNPSDRERASFLAFPARHNEFNINLAFVEAVLDEKKRRGRLALQYGTAVDRIYANEENKSIQTIQEGFAGVKLNDKLWMDAGIFFGHIGVESYISKNNINYSRALNAELVPYYSAGVKFEYEFNSVERFHLYLLNGWQNFFLPWAEDKLDKLDKRDMLLLLRL